MTRAFSWHCHLLLSCTLIACTVGNPRLDASRDETRVPADAQVLIPTPSVDAHAPPASDASVTVADAALSDAELDGNVMMPPRDSAISDADVETDAGCGPRQLAPTVHEHSCLHAVHGPFADLTAGVNAAQAADASRPHTAFRLTLPSVERRAFLRYTPVQPGLHAFFSRGLESIGAVSALNAATYAPAWTQPGDCVELPHVFVIDLSTSGSYLITIEATVEPNPMLVVEALHPFGAGAVVDACTCTLQPLDGLCLSDKDCCSNFCSDGTCTPEIGSELCEGGRLPHGDKCDLDSECCSEFCDQGICKASLTCRSDGPCSTDAECCLFCHDMDHCH